MFTVRWHSVRITQFSLTDVRDAGMGVPRDVANEVSETKVAFIAPREESRLRVSVGRFNRPVFWTRPTSRGAMKATLATAGTLPGLLI